MAISFQNALGIHEQALYLRSHRAEVLGNNLANVDTPNFKARDVDFSSLLEQAKQQTSGTVSTARALALQASEPTRTDARHMSFESRNGDGDLLYIEPTQPSIDGNTVEEHQEMARFAKNSMDFEASLYFWNSKFKGLQLAI
ncbi:MAG TPA: flagellar basal body rod protein FlgB, partial [Spongiibacteraceae bacterium]|nr:flagellar basal body rod protein FlgB [Spongiibacteraceae bacterium]